MSNRVKSPRIPQKLLLLYIFFANSFYFPFSKSPYPKCVVSSIKPCSLDC
nr:MAG TPA: hypothetical protein [Caudoviricetes sp.]